MQLKISTDGRSLPLPINTLTLVTAKDLDMVKEVMANAVQDLRDSSDTAQDLSDLGLGSSNIIEAKKDKGRTVLMIHCHSEEASLQRYLKVVGMGRKEMLLALMRYHEPRLTDFKVEDNKVVLRVTTVREALSLSEIEGITMLMLNIFTSILTAEEGSICVIARSANRFPKSNLKPTFESLLFAAKLSKTQVVSFWPEETSALMLGTLRKDEYLSDDVSLSHIYRTDDGYLTTIAMPIKKNT
jgi:hypothetical protein